MIDLRTFLLKPSSAYYKTTIILFFPAIILTDFFPQKQKRGGGGIESYIIAAIGTGSLLRSGCRLHVCLSISQKRIL